MQFFYSSSMPHLLVDVLYLMSMLMYDCMNYRYKHTQCMSKKSANKLSKNEMGMAIIYQMKQNWNDHEFQTNSSSKTFIYYWCFLKSDEKSFVILYYNFELRNKEKKIRWRNFYRQNWWNCFERIFYQLLLLVQ